SSLKVEGNRYFDEEAVRERMFMTPGGFLFSRGRYSEAFRKKDEENIGNLYRANGFRDVKITSVADRDVKGASNRVAVTVKTEEGPQWLVENVTIEGVSDEARRETFESRMASIPGQPFSEVNMAADRASILTWYFSNGYPKAELRASWAPS